MPGMHLRTPLEYNSRPVTREEMKALCESIIRARDVHSAQMDSGADCLAEDCTDIENELFEDIGSALGNINRTAKRLLIMLNKK